MGVAVCPENSVNPTSMSSDVLGRFAAHRLRPIISFVREATMHHEPDHQERGVHRFRYVPVSASPDKAIVSSRKSSFRSRFAASANLGRVGRQ